MYGLDVYNIGAGFTTPPPSPMVPPLVPWGVPNNSPTWALFAQQVLDVQLIGSRWKVFREFTGSIYIYMLI